MKAFTLGIIASVGISFATAASAESGALAPVERAYQEVDFPTTHDLAERALRAGAASREEATRLYVLLGISAAALGDAGEAKQDFVTALAIDPSLKLEKSLSPKIRDPYLEAQGYWSALPQRLTLSAKPGNDDAHLIIKLIDPAALVARIELGVSASGKSRKAIFTLQARPVTRFLLPAALRRRDYELALRALDRYGNVLAEYGVDADPVIVRIVGVTTPARASSEPGDRGRSYLAPALLGAAGLGALAAGVLFNVERERAAHAWNGPSCEQPGRTRLAQCQEVDSRVHRDEALAIGLYAGGGALLVSSMIALVAGRTREPEQVRTAALSCAVNGPGVACAGRF